MGLMSRENMDTDDITSSVQATYLHKVVYLYNAFIDFLGF